jgi:hypothetical protein
MAEDGLELGDYIVILGGPLNKTKGKLYQFSEDRFSLLPAGTTDRLIHIPLIDGLPDPELGILDIKLLKKAAVPGFVHLVDLRAGQIVETFLEGPTAGPLFKVVSVNEETDSAIFESEAGDQTDIVFGFSGIPRDLGYEVIRTRELPPEAEPVEQEDSLGQDVEVVAAGDADVKPKSGLAVGFDEEDVEEEGQVPTPAEEQAEAPTFMLGEEIELPEIQEIEEVGSAFRVYQDVFQRSEMLGQLIRNLPASHQRNPVKLQEVRRQVELMLIMRNDVVQYGITGEPLGKAKPTSKSTLADLIGCSDASLVKKVANVSKVLYLDHRNEHYSSIRGGNQGTDPDVGPLEDGLYAEYGADIIRKAQTLEATAAMGAAEGEPGPGMPRFHVNLENYRKAIQTPYRFPSGKAQCITQDEEVFRLEIPASGAEDANLNVLRAYPNILKTIEANVTNPPVTTQHSFGLARMLKPRIARFTTGEEYRVVETGENPTFNTVLVFPKSCIRDLGPIRSGVLAHDVSLGMTEPKGMDDILASMPDISDQPTSDGILSLGVDGSTVGNIMVKDWLKSLDLNLSGLGDTAILLRGYGTASTEWDEEQVAVLQEKIEQRLAAVRMFLIKQREENKSSLANLKFDPLPLLPADAAARLLDRIRGEPILQKSFGVIGDYMGELASIDVYWFTYIFLTYPDLLMATLGQQPATLAKERLKHVREQYINALNLGYRIKQKLANAGETPVPNTCPHVEALEAARKLGHKHSDEPRDTTKTKAVLKVLNRFRGKVEDDWVWCNRCEQHLVCGHELLQVQEFLRPKEKDALHKEIVLKFSGGQFGGKFICRVCGQGIQDLEFDTNIEFDDAGRPMMGRSVLVDQDAIEEEEINAMLSGPTKEEALTFPSDEMNISYKTIKKICSLAGINPEDSDYIAMVNELSNYLSGLPTRAVYASAAKGKKVQDYDIWYSIRYISAAAAIVLLNIQTHMPDYIVYYTSSDCKEGFFGYPLDPQGVEGEGEHGINCVSTVIAGVNDDEFPWNLTTLQKESNLQKRKNAIMVLVKSQIEAFLKFPSVQGSLKKKRDYRIKLYGSSSGLKKDNIASSFRPVPYITPATAAADAVVPDAATPEKAATAWIRMAHGVAAESAALNPDSPYSETTSCLHPLGQASDCWDKLPKLEGRVAGINNRSATVTTTFYTELNKTLEGKIDPKDYYKLFVKVCYQGPNMGLPHELGIGLTCANCDLAFQENPSLLTEQGKEKEESEIRIKAYLESQGIVINEKSFNELLMVSRKKESVAVDPLPYVPKKSDVFDWVIQYPAALDGWESVISKTQLALAELSGNGQQLTKIQIANASEDLVRLIVEKEEFLKTRLNAQIYGYLQKMISRSSRECGEAVSTYLLIPFQRWITGVNISEYKILKSYELSTGTMDDIMIKGLGPHLQILGLGEPLEGLTRQKAKDFVANLSVMCKHIFPYLRAIVTPGGKDMVQYLVRAYLMSAVASFIDPHQIPSSPSTEDTEDAEDADVLNIKLIYKGLSQTLTKFAVGSKIPSEEEIRIGLEQRAEKEKQVYLSKLERMTREERRVELVLKGLGMGDWAVGGTKAIRQYDADRYEAERAERAAAGIMDYPGLADANAADAHVTDMFGTDYGDYYDAAGASGDGGYDHDQMAEDDY